MGSPKAVSQIDKEYGGAQQGAWASGAPGIPWETDRAGGGLSGRPAPTPISGRPGGPAPTPGGLEPRGEPVPLEGGRGGLGGRLWGGRTPPWWTKPPIPPGPPPVPDPEPFQPPTDTRGSPGFGSSLNTLMNSYYRMPDAWKANRPSFIPPHVNLGQPSGIATGLGHGMDQTLTTSSGLPTWTRGYGVGLYTPTAAEQAFYRQNGRWPSEVERVSQLGLAPPPGYTAAQFRTTGSGGL